MNANDAGRAPLPPDLTGCLERVRRGDQAAARELIEQVGPMVNRIVRMHLPRRDSAEDLTQEVFIKMFTRLGQYRGTSSFRGWLAQVTRRTCYDHLRAQRCRPELRHADLTEGEVAGLATTIAEEHHRGPGEALGSQELLHHLLGRLTAEDRWVVTLFNLEQKSIAEISEITRWKEELVKMRVFRARRKLQQLLGRLSRWDGAGRRIAPAAPPSRPRRPARMDWRIGKIVETAVVETKAAA